MAVDQTRERERARRLLAESWESLARQAAATALYGPEDRRARSFEDAFVRAAQACMERQGFLMAEVDPTAPTWMGRDLLAGEPAQGNLARTLHGLGVRGVCVEAGADEAELRRLAGILCRDWSGRGAFDEDLETALWAASFRFVWVELEGAAPSGGPEARSWASTRLATLQERLRGAEPPPPQVLGQQAADLLEQTRQELALDAPELDELHQRVRVSERQSLALREEVAGIVGGSAVDVAAVGRVYFELLRLLEDPADGRGLGRSVAGQALALARSADLEGLGALLRRSLLVLDPEEGDPGPAARAFQEGLAELVGAQRGELASALDALGAAARGPLFTLLGALPVSTVPQLVALCAELGSWELRQVVADRLVLLHRRRPLLAELLDRARGREALAPLLALSRLGEAGLIEACLLRARDPDPQLREAAVKALRRHQAPRIRALVAESLTDPEAGVRIEALRYLSVYRDESQLGLLRAEILGGRAFAQASPEEARAWLLAFARVGQRQALDLLLGVAAGRQRLAAEPPGLLDSVVRAIAATQDEAALKELNGLVSQRPELLTALRALREEQGP